MLLMLIADQVFKANGAVLLMQGGCVVVTRGPIMLLRQGGHVVEMRGPCHQDEGAVLLRLVAYQVVKTRGP